MRCCDIACNAALSLFRVKAAIFALVLNGCLANGLSLSFVGHSQYLFCHTTKDVSVMRGKGTTMRALNVWHLERGNGLSNEPVFSQPPVSLTNNTAKNLKLTPV